MALSLSYRENWNFGNQCKSTDNVDLKKTKLGFTYKKKHKQKKTKTKTCRWASGHRPCNRKERRNGGGVTKALSQLASCCSNSFPWGRCNRCLPLLHRSQSRPRYGSTKVHSVSQTYNAVGGRLQAGAQILKRLH